MARHRFLLFDLDGTLVDTVGLILDSYEHTLAGHGLPPVPREHWLANVGRPLRDVLRPFAADEAGLEALVASYRAYNDLHHDRVVRAFPGVGESLTRLRAGGARLAVVTAKSRERAQRGLEVSGLGGLFEVVIGCDEVKRHKPHPEPVEAALALLGGTAAEAVMVGDSVHDLASGRAAGARTGAVAWGAGRAEDLRAALPDYWFERPEQLSALG